MNYEQRCIIYKYACYFLDIIINWCIYFYFNSDFDFYHNSSCSHVAGIYKDNTQDRVPNIIREKQKVKFIHVYNDKS